MKNLIFSLLILFCACKKESLGPQYPCPPEGEKSARYMCADISGHESFVTIGAKSMFTFAYGLSGDFYSDGKPNAEWTLSGSNLLKKTRLDWGITYPFKYGEKINRIYGTNSESSGPSFWIDYRISDSVRYSTDSLSAGWLIINYNVLENEFTGTFEVDLGNEKDINDRIKVTNGRFYEATKKDYYTIQD